MCFTSIQRVRSNVVSDLCLITLTDKELVSQARSGDRKAFETLYVRYSTRVFSIALSVVQNSTAAEDIVQETWIKAWGGLAGYRGDASFSTWIGSIAKRAAIDWLRVAARNQEDALEEGLVEEGGST